MCRRVAESGASYSPNNSGQPATSPNDAHTLKCCYDCLIYSVDIYYIYVNFYFKYYCNCILTNCTCTFILQDE